MDYNIKGIGNRKAFFAAFIAIAILSPPVRVSAGVIPKDLPTIEALIALHKAVKKDEDKAMQRVAASFGEQSLITKGAGKFNDVRTTLNTKLDNAHSYLVLAGAVSSTANSLYQLVKEYKDFTSNTFAHVSKKPFVAWYYADANLAISREVKHCYSALCVGGRLRHQPDEGFHGREAEPGDDAEKHHWQGKVHHRQCEPLLLPHYRLRMEAGLHLGDTELRGQGRDSKNNYQQMEPRI